MDVRERYILDLADDTHDLIFSAGPDGHFIYVNHAWLEALGYTRKDLAEITLFDVIHADGYDDFKEAQHALSIDNSQVAVQTTLQARDGHPVLVEGSLSGQFESDRLISTLAVLRDITARRKTEEELDRLFNLSLDLLCVAGTDGYFKQINPAFERVLGYSREELLSRSFVEFVHPDDREATLAEVDRLSKGMLVVDFQNRYLAKDGRYRWLAWRSAPVAERGLIYAVARDITEQKRIEETLARRSLELKRSNADLEQFAYVASHDLQAPLRAIRNISEWIEEDAVDELPKKIHDHLETLRNQVSRMEKLIDDLLKFARAGLEPVEESRVDVASMIHDLTLLLAPPKGFAITCASDMPVFETVRPPLEQVFRNLISNAVTHHDRSQGHVVVRAEDRGRFYEFSVTDDGPGIARESRKQVFKMFQKLTSNQSAPGTGMGLALVKKIVQSLGGEILIHSAGDRGTTFSFTWPKKLADFQRKNANHTHS